MTVKYLRDKDLACRYGVHRTTVWRWCENGALPQPVKLSPGCTRWRLSDLETFEARASVADAGRVGEAIQ